MLMVSEDRLRGLLSWAISEIMYKDSSFTYSGIVDEIIEQCKIPDKKEEE